MSPGFWLSGEGVRLPRDPTAFRNAVKAMVAAKPKLQLITTFNEWGEGTAVEPARRVMGSTSTSSTTSRRADFSRRWAHA